MLGLIGPDGKTLKVYEAERNPNGKRNKQRGADYNTKEIDNEMHGVGKGEGKGKSDGPSDPDRAPPNLP